MKILMFFLLHSQVSLTLLSIKETEKIISAHQLWDKAEWRHKRRWINWVGRKRLQNPRVRISTEPKPSGRKSFHSLFYLAWGFTFLQMSAYMKLLKEQTRSVQLLSEQTHSEKSRTVVPVMGHSYKFSITLLS